MIYAIGEIALIMIGILLVLQINIWNQRNKDFREERLVLIRFNNELSSNLDQIKHLRDGFWNKEKSLNKIALIIKSKNVENDSTFLSDVVVSSSYGWTVQSFSKSIYDEIINTGKLGIISNIEVRSSISQLYNFFQLYERVSLPRTSDYSQVVYSVVPLESDLILKRGLGDKEQKDMVYTLMNLSLDKYIIFEQNRIRFLLSWYDVIERSITELKIKIESELSK